MATVPSPNMSLPVPVVGVEVGPAWASDLNVCLSTLDSHTHAPGSGVQINPSGLNISSDLSFQSNNAILLRSTRFASQSSSFAGAADRACLYVVGNELYYNDASGTIVPITNAGSVNAGAGSITGLPTGTAGVSFASGTYRFNQATNTPANIDGLSYVLRNNVASGFGLTLSAPTLSANYSIVLPLLPSSTTLPVQIDTSGNMTAAPITGTQISATANIAGSQLSSTAGIVGGQLASATVTGAKIASGTVTTANISGSSATGTGISASIFTPATSVPSNIANGYTFLPAQYMFINNVCTVSGTITALGSSSLGPGTIRMTVPVNNSGFTASYQAAGTIQDSGASFGTITGVNGTNTVLISFGTLQSTPVTFTYTYTYQIP